MFHKEHSSAGLVADFPSVISSYHRSKIEVVGIETHVCVEQTGLDLMKLIRVAIVRCVHMPSILSFSSAEHSLRGTVDTRGIARPSIAATLYTASRAKYSSTRA